MEQNFQYFVSEINNMLIRKDIYSCLLIDQNQDLNNYQLRNMCNGIHLIMFNHIIDTKASCVCMLKSRNLCSYDYASLKRYLCINPFHYYIDPEFKYCNRKIQKLREFIIINNEYLTINKINQQINRIEKKEDTSNLIESKWIQITYHEYENKLNFTQLFSKRLINVLCVNEETIDDTINLYVIKNIKRDKQIKNCRSMIDHGIILYEDDNSTFLKVISSSSVFVKSHYYNTIHELEDHVVVKLSTGNIIDVFNIEYIKNTIKSLSEKKYENILRLTSLCNLQISFVKGWGENYQRQNVTQTPCWLDVKFIEGHEIIDRFLSVMDGPDSLCGSNT